VKVIGNLTKDAIIRAAVSEGISVTQVIGTPTVFETAISNDIDIAYDSNAQKVVIAYKDVANSGYGTAIVGTVSGNAISFGSPVIFESAEANRTRIAYDVNAQKVVIAYQDSGNSAYGTAIVGTVSGTSISFGTAVVFDSVSTIVFDIEYDSNAQKLAIIHRRSDNQGRAIVGTVSGTSISFGTSVVFNAASTGRTRAAFDSTNNKFVFAYEDAGNSSHGAAIVGTISGTSISFGSEVVFEADTSSEIDLTFDTDSQKIVIGYRDQGDSNIGKAIVGTVSGTSISFGTPTAFGAGNDEYIAVVYDTDAQKIVVAYRDTTTDGKLNVGTVSGTSISFGDEVQFEAARSDYINAVYDPVQKRVVIAYKDVGNSSYGTAVVTKTGYTSATGGTIADGKPVIVNANGTVSTVSQSSISQALGNSVVFESANTVYTSITYDANAQKVVIAYRDGGNSAYGTAIVGTVSGTSISFGSPVVFESANSTYISATYDADNQKVVIAYSDAGNSGYGTAIVGTVSGTSISFGSATVFESALSEYISATYDSTNQKVVVAYSDGGNGYYGTSIVGTVSGTSISFGSATVFESASSDYVSATYDTNAQKVVIAYEDNGNSSHGTAIVGTVSGTAISFGSPVVFKASEAQHISTAFDSDTNKVIIAFRASDQGTAIVGTVSGTSVSFGSSAVFENANSNTFTATYDSNAKKIVIAYQDFANSKHGTFAVGALSGTSINFDSPVVFESANSDNLSAIYDATAQKVVIAYRDLGNSDYGTAIVLQNAATPTNITSENFVGFMDGAALDGTNGEILSSCSIARNQTSLTPGQTYFVTPAGALSTTAGSPSVTAGTAISSTELIVKG